MKKLSLGVVAIVSVVLLGLSAHAQQVTMPKPIQRVPPVFPAAMRNKALTGEVVVGFEVDVKGATSKLTVIRSNNPGFEAAAIEAVKQWKFEPALRDGVPFATHLEVPIVFALSDESGPYGRAAVTVEKPSKESQENIPPQYRVDVPPRAVGVVEPVYPYTKLRDGVKGKASIVALIDERGQVVRTAVVEASDPAFGQALAAAFGGFEFTPALREGKPTPTMLRQEYLFDPDVKNTKTTDADRRLLAREQKKPESILTAGRLDSPLKATVRRTPIFPGLLFGKATAGEAVVELLIDEDGHARLPRVVSASDEAFGFSAVQALAAWQFEPPLAGGKPAVVRVQIPVKFAAPAAPAAAAEKPAAN